MGVATARTITLQGANGHVIDVQVDVSQGVVKTAMVGRPDASVSEARDRCRAAVTNSSFDWPATRRVTILLSPADLPKRGPHFDLAIAVAVLAASGTLPVASLAGVVFIGELTLDGRLRAVPGVLPMAMAASARGIGCVVVPEPQVEEAAMIPGMTVLGARSLAQVVALLRDEPVPEAQPVQPLAPGPLLTWRGEDRIEQVDLSDVMGMAEAKYALEVAAAGGHHVMLSGPKGAGKTTLAERLPGLLPDLTLEEALELSAIYSLAGCLPPGQTVMTRPPFRAPHHSATRTGMLGGGSGRVHPGEVSRAHTGALFLDEFPLFQADIIEGLREPLESGEVTIARGDEIATFPARTMFVLACNPCPCGEYHPTNRDNRCTCLEVHRREYRRKISGPIADRIDIVRHLEPLSELDRRDKLTPKESSAQVRARVAAARERQAGRYAGTGWRLNSAVPGPVLRDRWPLPEDAEKLVDDRVYAGQLTRRGATRVHRLAWTVADLRGADRPGVAEVDTALRLRTGEPLMLSAVEAVAG
ncbi:MAG TPA: YifB family Mg chelatase-like AAA ATPase [Nocardioidaceae bacterium]|nr:YifB family Mg chelatase-like AAA ATPase [Nocardioidaceae bacterium]